MVALSLLAACGPEVDAEFWAEQYSDPVCDPESPLPQPSSTGWQAEAFTYSDYDGWISLRFQSRSGVVTETDSILVRVRRADIEGGGTVQLGETEEGSNAVIAFYSTCPNPRTTPMVRGTLTIDKFGSEEGDRIVGSIDGPVIYDARTGDEIGTAFSGEFDVEVRHGKPQDAFTGPHNY